MFTSTPAITPADRVCCTFPAVVSPVACVQAGKAASLFTSTTFHSQLKTACACLL
jgi:hypothetical protein